MNPKAVIVISLAIGLFAVGPMGAMAQGPPGGGTVPNQAPTVESYVQSVGGSSADVDDVHELSGQVRDKNGEEDIVTLEVSLTGDVTGTSTRTVTATDVSTATEPAGFDGAGWKVWNSGAAKDGFLSFKFEFTYTERGVHEFSFTVTDELDSASDGPISVEAYEYEVLPDPVDGAGSSLVDARWGDWTAAPGATATGGNYLKIINGADPTQSIQISFTDDTLTGVEDASWDVPLADAIHYFTWEGPAGSDPVDAPSWTDGGLSATGGANLDFTGAGNVLYVYYTIDLPDPLKDQDYAADFTVDQV
jgi:hypothetical protein